VANPVLEKEFGDLPETAAATTAATRVAPAPAPAEGLTMTVGGTAAKTALLVAVTIAGGVWGWSLTPAGVPALPWWWWIVTLGAFVVALIAVFRPRLAPIAGPLYALTQGVVLGSVSHVFDERLEGVLVQALVATLAVFIVMLILYVTRAIRVTDRLRGVVIGATLGIAVAYLFGIVMALFGFSLSVGVGGSPAGIAVSLFVVGIAAFNLMLDFETVERGVAAGAPREFEWYAAFGLIVTIIWMYIEILRLIVRARSR